MSLHGLGVIGAQVAASIKSDDEKHLSATKVPSPSSIQSTPSMNEPTRSQDFDPSVGAKPYSPFYPHGTPTLSCEQLTFETKVADRDHSQLQDLENAAPYIAIRNDSPRRSKLWSAENPPRSCFQSLTPRQRMALKAVIALVTVGTMIAIALGITAAVGGAGWKESAKQTALGG